MILAELAASETTPAPLTDDDDFLRRIMLDLASRLPTPRDVTLFGLNPDSDKRARIIATLLEEPAFAAGQARYWRDVIFTRATEVRSRLMQPTFERWMTEQLQQHRGWNKITRDLLTATGDVRENGATALLFAQGGEAAEIAAETSRIFLGIQIQCANCHDHPSDQWKRQQFHQLAAYFPRVRIRRKQDQTPRSFEVVSFDASPRRRRGNPAQNAELLYRRLDRNRDGKLSKAEVAGSPFARLFNRIIERSDTNKDGSLSREEYKSLSRPNNNNRRFQTEYYMPDLDDPSSQGTKVQPAFFATGGRASDGLTDLQRRTLLANHVTSTTNPWFARAFVNRTWSVLVGEGFTMPIDDMGPGREIAHPRVLERLGRDFVETDYDVQRLFEVITNTQAYQRQIRERDPANTSPPFAATSPSRLRADQLYNALVGVLGIDRIVGGRGRFRGRQAGQNTAMMRRRGVTGEALFSLIFSFDPSTPSEDITGTVPQALFLMNSPLIHSMIRARGNTSLAVILNKFPDDQDAIAELYLLVLSREPTAGELKICREHIAGVRNRGEAYEDLMWSLINSSEFLSKR